MIKFQQAQTSHKVVQPPTQVITSCQSNKAQACTSYKTYDDLHSCLIKPIKVNADLHGVFSGKQYSALCINGKYMNLYIIAELIR